MDLRLVVDASVMSAAGDKEDIVSKSCREFIDAVHAADYLVAGNAETQKEWNDVRSLLGRRFIGRMIREERVVDVPSSNEEQFLHTALETCSLAKEYKLRLEKDLHLLASALYTDNRIASKDDKARRASQGLAKDCQPVAEFLWIHPANSSETPLPWLQQGAPLEPHRLLGHIEEPYT